MLKTLMVFPDNSDVFLHPVPSACAFASRPNEGFWNGESVNKTDCTLLKFF